MGCTQSKASIDQVAERVSNTPASEAPISESKTATKSEPAIEASVAMEASLKEGLTIAESEKVVEAPADEPASAAVSVEETVELVEPVEEEVAVAKVPQTEEVKVQVAPEDSVEEPAAQVEEVPGTGAFTAEERATTVGVEPEAHTTEEQVKTVEMEPEVSISEPVCEEQTSLSEPAELPAEEIPAEDEPLVETSQSLSGAADLVKPVSGSSLTFLAKDVTFSDDSVAYYNFSGLDSTDPATELHVSKRYSDFKLLHTQLLQQGANSNEEKTLDLPALPKTSFLQGRKNPKMLEDRKTQFTALLNVIAAHPVASHSDVFQAFLA